MSEKLKDPKKNPWYVLATIYGEQMENADRWSYDEDLAAKNRRAWNGWFCKGLFVDELEDRAKKTGQDMLTLGPLGKEELAAITKRFRARLKDKTAELPSRAEDIDFSQVNFSRFITFAQFVFEKPCDFSSSTFNGDVDFSSATFGGDASFSASSFDGSAYFHSSVFGASAYFSSSRFGGDADFHSATIGGYTDFSSSTFDGPADFNSAKFKSATLFTYSRFRTHVPEFHAAELYDDTVFAAR